MGMDVHGRAATTKEGEYFRRNVWGWHPLADLTTAIAPELCAKIKYWHTNDGDGFDNQEDCTKLADAIDTEIAKGADSKLIRDYIHETHRDVNSIREWVTFLRGCGGFTID